MIEVTNIEALAHIVEGAPVIAFDGKDGSGKTWTARLLAGKIGGTVVDFDPFVEPDRGFLGGLHFDQLRSAIDAAPRPVVLSGVCMMDILDRLGVSPDIRIYVKRMAGTLWRDEYDLFGDALEEEARAGFPGSPLDYEIREYHQRRKPHERATIIFLRQG